MSDVVFIVIVQLTNVTGVVHYKQNICPCLKRCGKCKDVTVCFRTSKTAFFSTILAYNNAVYEEQERAVLIFRITTQQRILLKQ